MTTTISIHRLRCYGHHGVMEQERRVGNLFEVSVDLRYPAADAVRFDSIADTLDYGEACHLITRVMKQPSALLEHAAGRIKEALEKRWPAIEGGHIEVWKASPPIGLPLGGVSVSIDW